jgi:hypothetical protein
MRTNRRKNLGRAGLFGLTALAASACGDRATPPESVSMAKTTEAIGEVGNPTCVPGGTRYTSGRQLFVERTSEWGLNDLNATGTRISVADVNGDHYPDLVVRRATDAESDFENRVRLVWVLKNTRNRGFEDVTRGSGLLLGRVRGEDDAIRNGRASQVVAFADVDNDGDLDAFSGAHSYRPSGRTGRERPEIMLNRGYGVFDLGPIPLPDLYGSSATFFDQDRDGWVDLFIAARERRVATAPTASAYLFRGSAAATHRFTTDIAASVGISRLGHHHRSSIACDLNHDGWPELLSASVEREPNALWQGTVDGFVERGVASGYAQDTNQSWEDNVYARAYCSIVREEQSPPEDLASCTGIPDYPAGRADRRAIDAKCWDHARAREEHRLGGNTFTTLCADFDGDGRLDLYNAEERSALEGQSADAAQVLRLASAHGEDVTFERPGRIATNLVIPHAPDLEWTEGIQTAAVLDVDNDGSPDLYIGGSDFDTESNVGHLYQNTSSPGTIHFDEVPPADGLSHARSQGIAAADFDRDGDLDLVIGQSSFRCAETDIPGHACLNGERIRFFENVYGSGGNWVQLKLVGNGGSNKAAIGARVTLELDDGRQLVQEVDGGHGHFGAQQDQVLHFGLGSDCDATVRVEWPDTARSSQTFELATRRQYRVVQGAMTAAELPLRGYCSGNVDRLAAAVGPGQLNDFNDVYCVQDRLAALGYRGITRNLAAPSARAPQSRNLQFMTVPQTLSVNGVLTEDTVWAIKTFQTTVTAGSVQEAAPGIVTPMPGETGYVTHTWLQAANAPTWRESGANGPGWTNVDGDNHDWGSSWTFDLIAHTGAALTANILQTNDISLPNGGVTEDHSSHEGGMDIDLRHQPGGGRWYDIAAVRPRLQTPSGTLWSTACPRPTFPIPGRPGVFYTGDNFVDLAVVWLFETAGTGCRNVVIAASTATPRTFADGFNRYVPAVAVYNRALVQQQIGAFLNQRYPSGANRASSVIFMDPVLMRNLRDGGIAATRLITTTVGHADHYHVNVAPPAAVAQ